MGNHSVGWNALGGFGDTFALPLIFSLVMLPVIRKWNIWIFIIAMWATVLINPHNWFARYVPQLWIIPVIVLCALSAQSNIEPSIKKRFSWIVYFMAFLLMLPGWAALKHVSEGNRCMFGLDNQTRQRQQLLYLNVLFPGQLHFIRAKEYGRNFYHYHVVAFIHAMRPTVSFNDDCHEHSLHVCDYAFQRVLYTPDESERLNQVLVSHASETILVAVKSEASRNLSEETKRFFRDAGGNIDQLKYRNAYTAVLQGGRVVVEKIDVNACELEFRDPKTGRLFRLASAGFHSGNFSSIKIDGKEHSPNKHGLNMVILSANNPPFGYAFDTWTEPNPYGIPHLTLRRYQVIEKMLKFRLGQLQSVWQE